MMKLLVIIGMVFITAIYSSIANASQAESPLERGKYLSLLGDCTGCHTVATGAPMAGGRAMATPFGKLYSTNITPDAATGIGKYSFEQFNRAMRKGVAADGHNLYPAMPYPSYAKMSEDDMRALFAYLQQGLAATKQANKKSEMHWPFSMRWGLALWNWLFLEETSFKADAKNDAAWNRGAYLVQSLGHCGVCHTPRGIGFQEKSMGDAGPKGKHYLSGATIEAWRALSLRTKRAIEDTVLYLKTGQNRFTTASGTMVEVIHHSTQHFSDADLTAIATYLQALPTGNNNGNQPSANVTKMAAASPTNIFTTRGGLGYAQFCVTCHQQTGERVHDIFPPLLQNPAVADDDPVSLIHITLSGGKTAETAAHPHVYAMPAFSQLSNQEIAEILTFVRASWGNRIDTVSASQVKKIRKELNLISNSPVKFETPRMADMLRLPNADQLVRGMRLHLETRALVPQNVGDSLNCTTCHLNTGTVADSSPFVGVSAFFPSYGQRAGKIINLAERINGCFKRSMHGNPIKPNSPDMMAMIAYFDWMKHGAKAGDKVVGRGIGKIDETLKPNVANGKIVYAKQCAMCHGKDGEGLRETGGRLIYAPLWGEQSFNIGAGMARTSKAAAFIKSNMPIAFSDKFPLGQGGLSDQDAVDVAEYFSHQPRPDFPDKVKDWPKDPKPKDSRY